MEISPVATIYTPFPSKFGIPRQSGLVSTESRLVFAQAYRSPEAVRGIEGFSHLWLIWEFTEAKREGNPLTVRPPRLGGNERVGVFASRSPFRPNALGLSCVKLLRVDYAAPDGPVLYLQGADLMDGTPVYDVKPYLPFADCVPSAVGGFADGAKAYALQVRYEADTAAVPPGTLAALTEVLSQDPRPHYQKDPDRIYAFEFSGWHVEFRCEGDFLTVTSLCRAKQV